MSKNKRPKKTRIVLSKDDIARLRMRWMTKLLTEIEAMTEKDIEGIVNGNVWQMTLDFKLEL